jgi:hypothetical protein
MPRVRRKGHVKRDAEAPIAEWSVRQLKAEIKRVETNPGELELGPWGAFKRATDLQNELDRRAREAYAVAAGEKKALR